MAYVAPTRPLTLTGRGALPLAVALVSAGLLVYAGLRDVAGLLVALAAAALLAALFALARRARRASARGGDAVTGLGARTELVAELDARLAGPDREPTLLLLFDLYGFKEYNDDFGRDAGDVLLGRLAEKLAAVAEPRGKAFRLTGDELCIVTTIDEGDGEELIDAATAALSARGEGFLIGCCFGGALAPYEAQDSEAALRLAEGRLSSQRRTRQRAGTMSALVDALSHTREAAPMTRRLESLALAVGGLLGLTGDRLEALARAVELHDIGELSIPREILDKPGPLDEAEWEFMRQQTVIAERILHSSPQLWGVAPIVRATYENWDGTGYPDGRTGEEIPVEARIIRVCHAFDAMMSKRAYRPALSSDEVLAELERRAGTSFDPAVVKVVAALVDAHIAGLRAA